nr:phosphotransferase [Gordonibacter massiliensis (ex Traore et al. 2017)]
MHRLHAAKVQCEWKFDIMANCAHFRKLTDERGWRSSFEIDELRVDVERVYHFVESDGVEKVLCHNDMCDSNIIVSENDIRVIDWEYAGMADPANDVCSFIVGGEHSHDEVMRMLELYFGRDLAPEELRHMFGAIALVSYHWLLWGVYRQSVGHDAGSLLYYWYRYASDYSKRALELYAPSGHLVLP